MVKEDRSTWKAKYTMRLTVDRYSFDWFNDDDLFYNVFCNSEFLRKRWEEFLSENNRKSNMKSILIWY